MIDPDLVRKGIHHCATEGKTCGACPIIAYCDWGEFEPDLIKTIDSMLISQQESKEHLLEEMKACFNEELDRYMKIHPECFVRPEIEVRLEEQ